MSKKKPEDIADALIDELSKARKAKGLSHQTLADIAGVNRSTISLIESKKRMPTILTCLKIADALDVKLSKALKDII